MAPPVATHAVSQLLAEHATVYPGQTLLVCVPFPAIAEFAADAMAELGFRTASVLDGLPMDERQRVYGALAARQLEIVLNTPHLPKPFAYGGIDWLALVGPGGEYRVLVRAGLRPALRQAVQPW